MYIRGAWRVLVRFAEQFSKQLNNSKNIYSFAILLFSYSVLWFNHLTPRYFMDTSIYKWTIYVLH